ncbi:guanylate kinase [Bacillota bacterium Meth-B3]
MKGKLYVVSGPSGAGKGTLCKRLLDIRPEIELSVSCATRAARPGEVHGEHYYFISEAEFLEKRARGDLLESARINNGTWYGTPKDVVRKKLNEGKSVLLEIENTGAQQVIERYPETVSVFILPPSRASLIKRLVDRGTEDLERLTARIRKVPSELEAARHYSHLILNDDLEAATARLMQVFDGTYRTGDTERALLADLTAQFADMDEALAALADYFNRARI